jgi:hypothetical protein
MEDSMKKMTDMSELTDRAEDRMFPADDMVTEYRATQIMRNRTKVLRAMAQEAGQIVDARKNGQLTELLGY